MILASCPLRISLFGGSTDNPNFIKKFGYGSVISFTADLKTYVTLSQDRAGYNNIDHKYIINYSKREEVNHISLIENELVRSTLEDFYISPSLISMTSDIYSHGSGLASSSSYLISLIKAISIHNDMNLSDFEICKIAYEIELKFNPYCGYQDPYGCGIGGFKKLNFYDDGSVTTEFLDTKFFNLYDMHLVFTGITRNSKIVLKDVSDNIDKSKPLLGLVNQAYHSLQNEDYEQFLNVFNKSWTEKKKTSKMIIENKSLLMIDQALNDNKTVLAHKLCGAGNGGFFLVISEKNNLNIPFKNIKINVSMDGVKGRIV
jgi:D-glycero-alpha-D-manno-heptose-7-phosphate kinase